MNLQQDKFGFSLMKARDISIDGPSVAKLQSQLFQLEPTARQCMQCGSCAASCTTAENGTNMRRAILLWMNGLVNEARQTTSSCLFCGKCRFVCPRGVNGRNILSIIHSQTV